MNKTKQPEKLKLVHCDESGKEAVLAELQVGDISNMESCFIGFADPDSPAMREIMQGAVDPWSEP